MDEIWKSAKEQLLERFSSPFIFSFCAAWCLWNWRFLVILFSDATVSRTFQLIQTVAFPSWFEIAWRGIAAPLFSALFYIFVYPYPALKIYAFTLKRQRETLAMQKQIEDETPMSLEDTRRFRTQYAEYERTLRKQIEDLNEEVIRLRQALETEKTVDGKSTLSAPPEVRLYPKSIEQGQMTILRMLDSANGKILESKLIDHFASDRTQAQYDLGELINKRLVTRDSVLENATGRQVHQISFTHDGRKVFLENRTADDISRSVMPA